MSLEEPKLSVGTYWYWKCYQASKKRTNLNWKRNSFYLRSNESIGCVVARNDSLRKFVCKQKEARGLCRWLSSTRMNAIYTSHSMTASAKSKRKTGFVYNYWEKVNNLRILITALTLKKHIDSSSSKKIKVKLKCFIYRIKWMRLVSIKLRNKIIGKYLHQLK